MGLIYLIQNNVNGKHYVGQTISTLGHRWAQHKNSAKNGSDWVISRAIRKHGKEQFSIQQLCNVDNGDLDEYEEMFIEMYNSLVPQGYNVRTGGHSSKAAAAYSRTREGDSDLTLYVTHCQDYKAGTEGYWVRHTPSGQSAKVSSRYLTMPQKLELALKFLEEAKRGTAKRPTKVYKPRELKTDAIDGTFVKELMASPSNVCSTTWKKLSHALNSLLMNNVRRSIA